ncbi:OsmC family protein [Niallia sp. 03133]|uniref:OsmC family protein n=1 Tax=Niallia sp. 03133 TaxID=3458060 RepID=UPI004043A3D5
MADHHFFLQADWPGLRNDVGTIQSGNLQTRISIPKEMDGPGIGTNPDEMLLGAAATCFIITFAAMMERNKINKVSLTLESEGIVDVTNGVFTYKQIIHRPKIVLTKHATEREQSLVRRLAYKAEASCMITRAIKGNVEVKLEETICLQK